MRNRPLLILATALTLGVGTTVFLGACSTTPRPPDPHGDAFQRYAFDILVKADSAAMTFVSMDAELAVIPVQERVAALGRLFARVQQRASRLAGDFDVVQPPPDFDRIHPQLVQPLRSLVTSVGRVTALSSVNCDMEHAAGLGCDLDLLRSEAATQSLYEFQRAVAAVAEYSEVRERAARMLLEHRVVLPPFNQVSRR